MSTLGDSEEPRAELVAELRDLRHEYSAHMQRHRLEQGTTVISALVTGVADVLENAVRLKFGAAARSAFALTARRVKLFDAEQGAPGREVAYLEHAAGFFAPQDS